MLAGADTGGTFTDLVSDNGLIEKIPSTPGNPGEAVQQGIASLFGTPTTSNLEFLSHGTTVATNALLERRGAPVALICSEGFEDVVEIARQDRPSLYDASARRPDPLIPRELRLSQSGRLDATGGELRALGEVPDVPAAVQAVAVCLLHSDLNPQHEQQLGDALRAAGHDVSLSCEIAPQFREYERTSTVVLNAYLRPICSPYLSALSPLAGRISVMSSGGGLLPLEMAADLPVALLLSGPAGGASAAADAAMANGFPNAIAFDMGGTSTDVCLIQSGRPEPASARTIDGYPVMFPSLDILTIGAGGGSIARIDEGGALVVGPRSAGARPGPACYGLGGSEPTVTDANLVAGRIPSDIEFPGIGLLDVAAATSVLDRAEVTALGVIAVVNANMERALRAVTVERGVDPATVALVAFGGAGPLHACDLADSMGIDTVIVPARAGVLSAVGLLCSPQRRELVRTWRTPLDHHGLDVELGLLAAEASELIGPGASVTVSVDCRYSGQAHELTVATVGEFHAEHRRRNGFSRADSPVEIVAIRAAASLEPAIRLEDLPIPSRQSATGPVVLSEPDCTVYLPAGWTASVGEAGAWIIRRDP